MAKVMKKIYILMMLCMMGGVGYLQAQELKEYPLDTINGEEVYKYRVERSIGLYRIGVNFDVPQADIIRLNPQLRERGLHFDEILYIPTKRKIGEKKEVLPVKEELKPVVAPVAPVVEEQPVEPAVVAQDSVVTASDSAVVAVTDSVVVPVIPEPIVLDSVIDGKRVVELALMLPFESQQTKRSANAARMMEFYQGALLALHDMQNDSIVYRLRVYDIERSERRVKELCDSTELDRVQAVLGLAYPVQIQQMIPWCEAHQVPLFLPFCDDIDLKGKPHVYQFNSPDREEAQALTRQWIAPKGDSALHCVAINVREADYSNAMKELRQVLKEEGIAYDTIPMRDLLKDSAAYAFDKEKENLIIVHSDRYQHVRVLMPHLVKIQEEGYRLRLVSQYSWQKESVNLPQVYISKFTTEERDVTHYNGLWEHYFVNTHVSETPRYDLLGYDLMREIIYIVNGQPSENEGLQSPIYWEAESEADGWQNTYIHIVEN